MKLCKDCKHYDPQWGARPRCGRTAEVDLVHGGRGYPEYGCDIERTNWVSVSCGTAGRFFEPVFPGPVKPLDNIPEVRQNQTFCEAIVKFFKRS